VCGIGADGLSEIKYDANVNSTKLTVEVDLPTGGETDPEALIKEARRRQRRRYIAMGVAVIAVVAGTAAALAGMGGPGGRHPGRPGTHSQKSPATAGHTIPLPAQIPRSVDTTLLVWPAGFGPCCGAVAIDNLSTRRLAQRKNPDIGVGDYQPLLTHVGHWLVYMSNGTVAIRDDLSGTPRLLGTTPFFAPSATPGHVWLFRGFRARLVPVAGGPPGPPIRLPAGAELSVVRGTDAGLLVRAGRSLSLALWNPGSRPRILPYSRTSADGFDATARLVAYGTGCKSQSTAAHAAYEPNAGYDECKMLRIFNVVTGRLISFAAPPGTAGWVPNDFNLVSAFSPGGRMIAAYAAVRPQGQGKVRLYLISIAGSSGKSRLVPSSGAYLFARTAWSPNGSWLFYQGPGQHLWAYQVSSGMARGSSTTCCQYTVMVAVPSHSG
jgi:hypothetical protein